ncbi:MAG: ABC transporter permease [Clostridium sp.]
MKDKIYLSIFVTFFIIVFIIILSPLILLMIRGFPTILQCLASEEVIFSIKMSLNTSLISTLICLFMAMPTAYFLSSREFRGKRFVSLLIYMPMSLPHLVSGIALLILCSNTLIFNWLSIKGIDFVFTKYGIVLAQVYVNLPFMIKILQEAFDERNNKMELVARTLGCSKVKTFFYITLPLIKGGLVASIIMTWCKALGEFGAVMMLAGTTRMKTEIMPTAIFLNVSTGDLDLALGIATILIIISVASTLIFNMINRRRWKVKEQ